MELPTVVGLDTKDDRAPPGWERVEVPLRLGYERPGAQCVGADGPPMHDDTVVRDRERFERRPQFHPPALFAGLALAGVVDGALKDEPIVVALGEEVPALAVGCLRVRCKCPTQPSPQLVDEQLPGGRHVMEVVGAPKPCPKVTPIRSGGIVTERIFVPAALPLKVGLADPVRECEERDSVGRFG